MGYPGRYETSHLCPCPHRRGAHGPENRSARVGWRGGAPLPDGVGQRSWRAGTANRGGGGLRRENGAPVPPALQSGGAGDGAAWLLTPAPAATTGLPRRARRAVTRALASPPARLWPSHQSVDAGTGGRGQFRPRPDRPPGQWRSHPADATAPGHRLETRQALEPQPRSGVCPKKRRRDRLMALAQAHADWALGFADEVWWSRLAQPRLHAWGVEQPLRLVEQTVAKDDPDPKALACYGLLVRRAGQEEMVWLRFVAGRPISAITIQFLEWCCLKLAALGVPLWALIWDNASWHVSKAVRAWIRTHNRAVKQLGQGVRILACSLP